MPDKPIIALDVGGSSVKSGLVDLHGPTVTDHRKTSMDSTGSRETILATLAEIVRAHRDATPDPPQRVALAFPGPFDYDTGVARIRGLEKFEAIYGVNVRDDLVARVDSALDVRFRNDAEAAILGEATFGVGQSFRRIIGITLGTGMGSAYIADGESLTGGNGVPPDGWLHPFASEGERADDVFSTRGFRAMLDAAGIDAADAAHAADLARDGDPQATALFARFGTRFGRFLAPFVNDFAADAVLVLGGIAQAFDCFGPHLQAELPIPAVHGELDADAPLLGAALLFAIPSSRRS